MNVETKQRRGRRSQVRPLEVSRAPNFDKRLPVDSLKILADLFKGNPDKLGPVAISEQAGIATRTVREVILLNARRPDLAKEFFADKLSLYQAGRLMRAEPEKWQSKPRSRTMTEQDNNQTREDQHALEGLLGRYLTIKGERPSLRYIRLRKSVRLEPDGQGGQLLLTSDLYDALWDAAAPRR